jgi:hypothetical protein
MSPSAIVCLGKRGGDMWRQGNFRDLKSPGGDLCAGSSPAPSMLLLSDLCKVCATSYPLNQPRLSAAIIRHLKGVQERRCVESRYVFSNHDGTKPADIKTAWENAVKEARLQNVCFHSLRHTAASHLCMGGFRRLRLLLY